MTRTFELKANERYIRDGKIIRQQEVTTIIKCYYINDGSDFVVEEIRSDIIGSFIYTNDEAIERLMDFIRKDGVKEIGA